MSFQDQDSAIDPTDFLTRELRRVDAAATVDLDANPDDAVRAGQLAKATGIPAPVVYGDLEHYDNQYKAGLTQQLLQNNPELRAYVAGNPMAAKVSNDDYGVLDAVSDAVKKYWAIEQRRDQPAQEMVKAGIKAFSEAAALGQLDKDVGKLNTLLSETPGFENIFIRHAAVAGAAAFAGLVQLTMGAIAGTAGALGEGYKQAGGSEAWANRLTRDLVIGAQVGLSGQAGFHGVVNPALRTEIKRAAGMNVPEPIGPASTTADVIRFLEDVDKYAAATQQGAKGPPPLAPLIPYIKEGKATPTGVHPLVDEIHKAQAVADAENLTTAVQESVKSATRERDPDLFAGFIAEHNPGEIGVPFDAVRKLYGDKVPAPDDGLLGWVPRLQEQLAVAEATGGDITIPTAEYLARVEPEVHRELKDWIRSRPEGVTVEEGKNLSIQELPENLTYENYPIKAHIMELGEGSSRRIVVKDAEGRGVLQATLNPFSDDSYQLNHIVNDSNWLAAAGAMPKYSNLGERTYIEAARVAASEGKKLYVGASGSTSRYAKDIHERLFTKGYASVPDKFGIREVYPERRSTSVDTVRQAAGLLGPQPTPSLTLSRTGPPSDGFHTFDVMGPEGQKATLDLSESSNGKAVRIEMLTAREGVGAIGLKGLSAIAEQIALEFPNAERIEYHHISGAKGEKPVSEIDKTKIELGPIRERMAQREAARPQVPEPGLLQQVQEAILGKSPEAALAEAVAMEERALFDKASAIGMTVDQFKRYARLIEKRVLEDMADAEKHALAEQRKRQTAEWKANRAEVRAEVAEEIKARPEVELDKMLREQGFKLAREGLTDEQAVALPSDYIADKGIFPDDLASMFGDRTGGELIGKLIALSDARVAAGMKPGPYLERIIDVATDHAMEARYGALDRNIIEEAKDQVLSETQEELLHEEVLARATEAGLQLSITKDELKAAIKTFFDRQPARSVSSDKGLAEAGRAGRAAEMALLKGDYAEAFRQKQRQFNAFTMANYAKRFEKAQTKFEKVAAKYKKVDVARVEPATRNYIQGMLAEAGYPLKVTPEEIAASIAFEGHGSLNDYVAYLDDFGMENAIPESILEDGIKPLDDMSVAEFADFQEAIESLDHIGREQRKINVAGEKQDFAVWKAKAIANLKERPIRSAKEAENGGKWLYRIDAPWTRPEEMFKDFDMRRELGPFFEAVVIPYELSKAKSYSMLEKLSKELRAIPGFKAKWQRSLEEAIPNDFIYDVWNETMFELNRWNMVKMMLNWGNESNAMKLSEGILRAGRELGDKVGKEEIAAMHERIGELFTAHATKEDWKFVQKIWDVFEGWKGEVDTLHRNVSGKAPKWVQGREVVTPHGVFKGGYFPLIPDKLRRVGAGIKEKGQPDTGPLGHDYFRATTNQKHLKTRTGATYFVDITNGPEQLVGRMQQVIHDLAYRDFVINAGKVLYDTEIKNAIQKYYGLEYEQQLIPWLKRVANQSNAPEAELQGWNDVLKRFRGNLVAAALPLNYVVMFSPSVGVFNVKKIVEFNVNRAANKKLVMENSKEVPHMIYTMDRDLTEAMRAVTAKKTWTSYQLEVVEKMFRPLLWVEQQFRMATFYGEFMKQKAKGRTDFQASAIADSIVRERHTVGAIGDLPSLMASKNEFVKLSTLFMGYFTAQRNWMRQMPHYARQREWGEFGKVLWGSVIIAAAFNALLFTDRKKDEGLLSHLGRSVASVPLSGVPILRSAWNYFSEGYRQTDPITSWAIAVGKLGKDGWSWYQGKKVKKPIKDTMTVLGGGLGVPGSVQIGRTGQGVYDAATGEQRPKNILEWGRLMLKGEAQLKK